MDKIKYSRGQKVFVISSKPYRDTCDICKGVGEIKLKGRFYTCPECDGNGKTYIYNRKWRIFEGTIKTIYINEAGAISYTVCSKLNGDYIDSIDECDIFIDKKSALVACRKRK